MELLINEYQMLEETWDLILPSLEEFSTQFYDKLFEKKIEFKSLFSNDLARNQKKLLTTIDFMIKSIKNIDEALVQIHRLGKRHKGYRVKKSDYKIFIDVFIETIEELEDVNLQEQQVLIFRTFLEQISNIMIEGSRKNSSYFAAAARKSLNR